MPISAVFGWLACGARLSFEPAPEDLHVRHMFRRCGAALSVAITASGMALVPAAPGHADVVPGTIAVQNVSGSSVRTSVYTNDTGATITMSPSTYSGVVISQPGWTIEIDPPTGSALTSDTTYDANAAQGSGRPTLS